MRKLKEMWLAWSGAESWTGICDTREEAEHVAAQMATRKQGVSVYVAQVVYEVTSFPGKPLTELRLELGIPEGGLPGWPGEGLSDLAEEG